MVLRVDSYPVLDQTLYITKWYIYRVLKVFVKYCLSRERLQMVLVRVIIINQCNFFHCVVIEINILELSRTSLSNIKALWRGEKASSNISEQLGAMHNIISANIPYQNGILRIHVLTIDKITICPTKFPYNRCFSSQLFLYLYCFSVT